MQVFSFLFLCKTGLACFFNREAVLLPKCSRRFFIAVVFTLHQLIYTLFDVVLTGLTKWGLAAAGCTLFYIWQFSCLLSLNLLQLHKYLCNLMSEEKKFNLELFLLGTELIFQWWVISWWIVSKKFAHFKLFFFLLELFLTAHIYLWSLFSQGFISSINFNLSISFCSLQFRFQIFFSEFLSDF